MSVKANIILSSLDVERLEKPLDALPRGSFPGQAELRAELDRGDVVAPKDVPPNVVTMNSTVRFVFESGKEFSMTLVYPEHVEGDASRISILAPVGSALLGLTVGEHIEWPQPGGGRMKLTVKEVLWQPERAGEFHR